MQVEIWKDIPGYEGSYQVSNLGNVKSLFRMVEHRSSGSITRHERLLKIQVSKRGYKSVRLYSGLSKWKQERVHGLVLLAFVGKSTLPSIDHINGKHGDNRLENLRYCTQRDNNIASREKMKTSSKYVGVSFINFRPGLNKKWRAQITINKKQVSLGVFETEEEASIAYRKKVHELKLKSNERAA